MFTGMSIILYLVYSKLGGVTEAHSQLAALKPEAMKIFGKAGHEGWTQMPKFGSEFWWIIVSTIIMGVGIGVLAQPQLAVRYMTVKSTRELNRAIFVGGIFILIITGVAYITGALSNVFFFQDPEFGKISLLAANKNVADIIPLFITTYMPKWLGDLFFVTLMAAAMTTVSSQFHAMGTAVGRDIFQSLKPHKSEDKHIITATRIGIIITFIMSVFLAWYLPMKFSKSGTSIIARGTSIFFGLCASTFLPVYLGGLYTKAITKTGAICGAFSGFLASAFWLMFVHLKESSALLLCERFFDAPSILHNTRSGFILWHAVDPLFIGLPVACIVTVIISAVTKKFSEEHIANCFHGIK
jgi:SSS family solute:Na+ symporter